MADEEQTKRTRSPKQQLLLLAIPGALPWLTVALYALTGWLKGGREGMALSLVCIQCALAIYASIATFTVKGQPVLQVVVALFDVSFLLAFVVPLLVL